ncbi:hypothetical protein AGMMS50256_26110 [Betaproteobacteria bacterium]|nr:hypothetical protein AGMMS50256_26110 [Betaproteobacteria bacterium]
MNHSATAYNISMCDKESAVQEWLARCNKPQWPEVVLNFTGIPDMPAFEAGREHLAAARDDPLA